MLPPTAVVSFPAGLGPFASQASMDAIEALSINAHVTYDIGPTGDFATIQDAVTELAKKRLGHEIQVTLNMEDGVHSSGQVTLRSTDIRKLKLTSSGSANVTINCTGSYLFRLYGCKLQVEKVTVDDGGFQVLEYATLEGLSDVIINTPSAYGIYCYYGSQILGGGAFTINDASTSAVYLTHRAYGLLTGITINNPGTHGVRALNDSYLYGSAITIDSSGGHSIYLSTMSRSLLSGVTVTNSAAIGIIAIGNSNIQMGGTNTLTGNATSNYSPSLNVIGNDESLIFT